MGSKSRSTTSQVTNTTNVSNVTDSRSITNISSDMGAIAAGKDLGLAGIAANENITMAAFDFGSEALERVDQNSERSTNAIGGFALSALNTVSNAFDNSLDSVDKAYTSAGEQVGVNTNKVAEAFSKTTSDGQVVDLLKVISFGSFALGASYIILKNLSR